MSNRYNTLLQDRYVSTYVPLPLEQISGLAQDYTDRYNTGKNLPKQFDLLSQKINAAPVDYDNKDKLVNDYKSRINNEVNNAKPGDFAKPEFQDKISSLTKEFANDPRLQSIIANKHEFDKNWDPYLNSKESKEDLILSNITDKDNPNIGYKAHSSGYKQLKPGEVLQPLDYIKYQKSIDGVKTIMDNIAIKGNSLSSIKQWSKDGNYFIDTDGHHKEVSKKDVYNVAKANVGNYAENTEGKFRFKSLLNKVGLDAHMNYTDFMYNDKIPDNIKEDIKKEMIKDLYNYGTKQIFEDDNIKYNLKDNVLKQHEGIKEIDTPKIITTNEQGNPETTDINGVLKGLGIDSILNENGELKINNIFSSTYKVTKVDGTTKEFTNSQEAHSFAGNTGSITQQRIGNNKSADDIVNEAYVKLPALSKKLGLDVPADGNYKNQIYNYAIKIAKQRSTTSNLQPNTSEKLTEYFLGNNSNMHNMEVYEQGNESSNAKMTNESVGKLANNSKITGIDYFGNNQAGWKIAVTPKDDKGDANDIDKALIAIPRDKTFEKETRSVYTISKGALEFSKTGEVSNKYKDGNYDQLQEYANKYIAGKPKIAASSTEYTSDGKQIIRGSFIQMNNGEPILLGIEYIPNSGIAPNITSLDNIQNKKTEELQTNGSLNQYINSLEEKTKPSKIR